MSLDAATHERIASLLKAHRVVLFMKGQRQQPMCGFSAAVVRTLDELLPGYHAVNVLDDPLMREGIKAFGQWPTIPQLYVDGDLVGGADIIQQMYGNGQLHQLLGLLQPDRTPPDIAITEKAAQAIRQGMAGAEADVLHLEIDSGYNAHFKLAAVGENDIVTQAAGLEVHVDLASAERAHGVAIDWVSTVQGEGLRLTFPEAPVLRSIDVEDVQQRLVDGSITLVDVRPAAARSQFAPLPQARLLENEGYGPLSELPRETPLAFICQRGISSRRVAERFARRGFTQVHNVDGGMEAWVARYKNV